jgi:hypothetical protein
MVLFRRKTLLIIACLLMLGAGVIWWQREPLLAWYCVRQLAAAGDDNRDAWVARIVELDRAAVPGLLDCLTRQDAQTCANIETALLALVESWGPGDARGLDLVDEIVTQLEPWSPAGKQAGLQVPLALLRGPAVPAERLAQAAGRLAATAAKDADSGVQACGITLAAALIQRCPHGPWLDLAQPLALSGLTAPDPGVRVSAVNLALQMARRADHPSILTKVVSLLGDSAPAVRRAALIAVGPNRNLMPEGELVPENLFPLLHDTDAEVKRLCGLTLVSWGFPETHIELARRISAPDAMSRLQVLDLLRATPELEPGIWLRRMSHDPDRAVRAAAIRAACKDFQIDMTTRIRQMAQDDPSDTVRQIATTYLKLMPSQGREFRVP